MFLDMILFLLFVIDDDDSVFKLLDGKSSSIIRFELMELNQQLHSFHKILNIHKTDMRI